MSEETEAQAIIPPDLQRRAEIEALLDRFHRDIFCSSFNIDTNVWNASVEAIQRVKSDLFKLLEKGETK